MRSRIVGCNPSAAARASSSRIAPRRSRRGAGGGVEDEAEGRGEGQEIVQERGGERHTARSPPLRRRPI